MHRNTVLDMANKAIKRDFKSISEAARFLGVDRATLSLYLNDHERVRDYELPDFLLNYLGLGKVTIKTTTYHKVK